MPVVKFFACLDLDQNSSFLDGLVLAMLVEHASGFLEMRKLSQLRMPMSIPTA
jgi:hypothetical protein